MKSKIRKVGLVALVGGLFAQWLKTYFESGFNSKNIIIDITSLEYLRTNISKLFNILRLDVWIIIGDEISSNKRLAIIYAGHEVGKNMLMKLAFSSSYSENYIGKKWLWKIPEVIEEVDHDCSLMITEAPCSFSKLFEGMKCFYIPFWVDGEIDMSVDSSTLSKLFKHKNSSLKSDLSKIKRNRLYFEVRNEPSQLYDFYYNMYIPYITKAHGNRSEIESYDYLKRELKKGSDLLLIKKEGEYIAGGLLIYKKNRSKLHLGGIKYGNSNYIKDGAIGALFYFSVHYLAEKGITKIDLGSSRPFLKDGLLRYKKKWNQKIYRRTRMGFLFKPLLKTDGVKGFLVNNPFIYQDQTGLNGAIFLEGDQSFFKEYFSKICKDHYIKGLSKLMIYQFGEAGSNIRSTVPPEYSDIITMCSAESLFKQ